ncbi:PAS domain S-box protein [Aquirufa sp.]|jgi:PAS domain S-box-containing protein|uniref:PAS domain S-box protein n=1 Tax=Aquirufa sp. TaxID=2676249 RepID=UPI0037BF8889
MAVWANKTKEDLIHEIQELKKQLDILEINDGIASEATSKENLINTLASLKLFGIIMALDGTIVFANAFTHALFEYKPNELNGKDFFATLLPQGETEDRRASFQKAIDSGGLFEDRERNYITKTGSMKWVEVASTIVKESNNTSYLSIIGEDITERKKVTEALSRSNAQLRDLINNTTDLIQITGVTGRFLFVNKAWLDTMGYSEEEARDLKIQDVLHPEFAHNTQAQFDLLARGEELPEFTAVFKRKDGRRLYVSGSASCRLERGTPTAYRCILHNSTAKVRAERANKLFSSIAQVAINSTNLDDLYVNIHKQLGEVIDVKNFFIAQYDPGKSFLYFPYYIDEYFDSRVHFTKRKLGNGLTEYAIMANKPLILHDDDIHQLAADKKIYLYGVVPKVMLCVPLRIGDRVTGIIGVKSYERANKYENRDLELLDFISSQVAVAIARKQAEEALARETARLNAIFEGSSHLMWSVNKRLMLTSFNQEYAELLEKQLQIKPQLNFSTESMGFQLVAPQERRPLEDKYKLAFRGQKQHFELELMTKSGEQKWLEIYLNPIQSEALISEVSGIARDITDLKKYQTELVEAREQAEYSLKVKEQFLANMSHEIRTPMNGVIGMVDLLCDSPLNEDQQDYLQTIRKSSETLLHILNDILDLAKIEAGKMVLHPADLVFEDLLDRLMSLFTPIAHQKGNKVAYSIAADVPKVVVADETRLLQILSNLTSNALKFTENGSVMISVSAVKVDAKHVELMVRVTDTGIGISGENLKKLFSAFQQLDNSTSKNYGGTGLGLAISQEFCKMMEGEIGVESEEGKGSTFWFTVQLAIGDASKASSISLAKRFDIAGTLTEVHARILLVDDNATNRKVASQILIKAGCVVKTVTSGQEAIDCLMEDANFDLVLMDIQMPELDGMETARLLHTKGIALPPIVAMTAYAMKEDRERFLASGMNDYIAKPIRAQQLIQLVGKWVHDGHAPEDFERDTSNEVVDEEVLKSLSDAVGEDPAFVQGMLAEFIAEAEEQIAAAEQAYAANDCKGVQSELHTLKGNSGTLGAAQVNILCEQIELKAKVCEFSQFAVEIVALKDALATFKQVISDRFA